jgi:hypothetical protein
MVPMVSPDACNKHFKNGKRNAREPASHIKLWLLAALPFARVIHYSSTILSSVVPVA